MTQRNISISGRSRHKLLHIEAPGCIVNIRVGLTDTDGREVVNVSVTADGDRYAGDPEWWMDGKRGETGGVFRVVCTGPKPAGGAA